MQVLPLIVLFLFALECYLAVPYGFLGVRGKKAGDDLDDNSVEMEIPVRLEDEQTLLDYLVQQYNRQNGPQNNQWSDMHNDEKRVPYGFMGTRGKRSSGRDNIDNQDTISN
ncbi:uncharacterized protein LOC114333164 isoform X2 [Diabrotica virgifera virgifera]|uniref:Uncharacterized protein LOC114333164 isoform X2 n=1 Tax=Diabrotica virgifera virgifera TaxID=50390 RepID=A0A6P7FR40_DIAVI|nr:uncharacterized protein LOC114333164 isoform X2 [Diabrotica virgifera virgifera]